MKQHLVERLLYVVLALVFVAAGLSTYFAAKAVDKLTQQQEVLQQQAAGQKEVLNGMRELLASQGATTKDINRSLACILVFFSSPNRASYYISDFSTCTITNTVTGTTQALTLPSVSSAQQPEQSPSTNSQSSTRAPAEPSKPSTPSQPESPAEPTQQPGVVQSVLDGVFNAAKNIIGGVSQLLEGR